MNENTIQSTMVLIKQVQLVGIMSIHCLPTEYIKTNLPLVFMGCRE